MRTASIFFHIALVLSLMGVLPCAAIADPCRSAADRGAWAEPVRLAIASRSAIEEAREEVASRQPVIYCTDLFHPHDDIDDHFDLAAIYAVPGIDLKAIILDQGDKQLRKPGATPVAQMNRITGRDVPCAIGLARKLRSPTDKGLDEAPKFQAGVDLILKTLRESPELVTIVAVGSLRDVAAAYNREPELLKSKVDKLIVVIGEASLKDFQEYNAALDPHAYSRIMSSRLNVYWAPARDGGVRRNNGKTCTWVATHQDLLEGASDRVLQYFIYAFTKSDADPISFLQHKPDAKLKERLLSVKRRRLWSSPLFVYIIDRLPCWTGDRCKLVDSETAGAIAAPVYDFFPVHVSVDEQGAPHYKENGTGPPVMQFRLTDRENYPQCATGLVADLIEELDSPDARRARSEESRDAHLPRTGSKKR